MLFRMEKNKVYGITAKMKIWRYFHPSLPHDGSEFKELECKQPANIILHAGKQSVNVLRVPWHNTVRKLHAQLIGYYYSL
jgi:hypothetical protein